VLLASCSSGSKNYTLAPMAVPFNFHNTLTITVLSYKLVASKEELPRMTSPPANAKYVAIRLMLSNPGKDKGKPSAVFPNVVDKIEILHPSFGNNKGIKVYIDSMSETLENYIYGERGMAFAPIGPGESHTGWIIATIPKDANPPYVLRLTPSDRLKPPGHPMEASLSNF